MPTGYDLKNAIAGALNFHVDASRQIAGGDALLRESMYQLGQRQGARGNVNDYLQAARLIHGAMPQAPSIDNFIDSHRADVRVAECGKLAIARQILKAERSSSLFVDPGNLYNKIKFDKVDGTWFNALFQLLALNCQLEDLPARLERVRVVSFNYDRTLEHFLHQSIQNYYGCSTDEATKALSCLVVLHPYGHVGALPWQGNGHAAVPFGAELNCNSLLAVASTLRTFTEGTDADESQIEEIRSSVYEADILVFLGFAYHELNLELLFGRGRSAQVRHAKQVFGTAKGLSESNKKAIAAELATLGKYDLTQITLRRELTAAELFSEYSRNLRIPDSD